MGKRDLTESVLAAGVYDALAEMGFKHRSRTWVRRDGDITFFIDHQSLIAPSWTSRARLEFGISFKLINEFKGLVWGRRPRPYPPRKIFDCTLERSIFGTPEFELNEGEDPLPVARAMVTHIVTDGEPWFEKNTDPMDAALNHSSPYRRYVAVGLFAMGGDHERARKLAAERERDGIPAVHRVQDALERSGLLLGRSSASSPALTMPLSEDDS